MCGDRTTDRILLQGTLIGALQSSSADLHTQLQSWVDTSPTVEVIGIPLQLVPCSTYPGEEASCEFQGPTASANVTASTPGVIDSEQSSSSGLGGITLYAALGGGMAVLIGIIIVVILLVALRRRGRKQFTPSRYLLHSFRS